MDNKKLVFLKQLSTFVENRSLWVEPNRKYDFRLSLYSPLAIFTTNATDKNNGKTNLIIFSHIQRITGHSHHAADYR